MTEMDRIKYERLFATVRRNFRVTRLFKQYLEEYPEVITADMIAALTEDGETTAEVAISALLSEIFGLEFDNVEDRRIIMDYLTPSIRILDKEKYENNPYYKNIKLENLSEGSWEIRWEEYKPYQGIICDDMIIKDDFCEIPPLGYFPEGFRFPAILEGGNEWMTLTPVDLDTSDDAISAARGRVLTYGLGLGYFAYMASEKENVESVTVVELSDEVIALFKTHILPKMPNGHKINIVRSDALEYARNRMPHENFDFVFVDTWRDASDGAPMYKAMKPLEATCPGTEFMYWVEGFLRSRVRAEMLSDAYDDFLIGKLDTSYDEFIKKLQKI